MPRRCLLGQIDFLKDSTNADITMLAILFKTANSMPLEYGMMNEYSHILWFKTKATTAVYPAANHVNRAIYPLQSWKP